MTDKLKPCKCGTGKRIVRQYGGWAAGLQYFECKGCHRTGPMRRTRTGAIIAWNRRIGEGK
jgi:hypothetical protein